MRKRFLSILTALALAREPGNERLRGNAALLRRLAAGAPPAP